MRNVVDRRLDDVNQTTKDDERRRGVSASGATTTEGAIRLAAKLAIDAGDLDRARALLDLLDAQHRPGSLLTLSKVKPAR